MITFGDICIVGFVVILVILSCSGDVDHDVDSSVETTHKISFDLEMCRDVVGTYRSECVDKFLETWSKECKGETSKTQEILR